eukprot:4112577-Pyramimonas_sp.AAC.1
MATVAQFAASGGAAQEEAGGVGRREMGWGQQRSIQNETPTHKRVGNEGWSAVCKGPRAGAAGGMIAGIN